MCDPVVTVVSLAFSAYAANEAGKDRKAAAKFNAREAENRATELRNKGVEEENKHRRKVAELQSRQRAKLGAANIDLNSGSALQLQEDTALFGEVDALRIRSNFSNEAGSLDRSAELLEFQGDAAERAGQNQAVGSLISAGAAGIEASGVSSRWYNSNSSAVTTTSSGTSANAQVGGIA